MDDTYFEGPSLREYQPFFLLHNCEHDDRSDRLWNEFGNVCLRLHNFRISGIGTCRVLEISEVGKCIKEASSGPDHVFIEGLPGVGKSAFTLEMCKKWASGELLQDWSIVIFINLCNQQVREAKLLSDFLYYPNQVMREKICQDLVTSKGKQVLLIVDGLDRLNEEQMPPHGSVYQQLTCTERNLLPSATLLILSKVPCVPQWQRTDKIIQPFCFTKDNIKNYITSACSGDDSKLLADFESYLSSHPYIHNLMHIPAQCVLITDLYLLHWNHGDTEFSPSTLTELYTDLVTTLLLRYLCCHHEYGQREWVIDNFTDLPEKAKESFMALAQLAAKGIEQQKYVFNFPEDFQTLGLETEFESFGLMQRVEEVYPGRKSESFVFLHLTLQEYMAAYYCSQQDTFKRLQTVVQSPFPVKQFLSYYCYDDNYSRNPPKSIYAAVMLFTAGLTSFSWDDQILARYLQIANNEKGILLSAMHLLYETQSPDFIRLTFSSNHDLPAKETGKYGLLNFPQSYHLTSTDFFVSGYCMSHSNRTWLAERIYYAELLSKGLAMSFEHRWSSIGHIAVLITEARHIPLLYPHTQKVVELTIENRNEQENDCTDIFTNISTYCPLLKSLTVHVTPTTCLTPLFEALPSISSLENVFFCLAKLRCDTNSDNLSHICEQLQACPTKHRIKVTAEGSSYNLPTLPLTVSSKLECLELSWLTLTPSLFLSGDFSSLTVLKLDSCQIPDDACTALVQFLQSPQCVLKELSLILISNNYYGISIINKLVQGIGSNCTLKVCYIKGYNDAIIEHLVAGLQESKDQSCLEELILQIRYSMRNHEQYDELIRLVNEHKTIRLLRLTGNADKIVRKFDIRENLKIEYFDDRYNAHVIKC